jgi:uncharacterized protein (TIGR03437 family)
MIGGQEARVVNASLTNGTAGLYQITIQLPASLPAGAAMVQATVGGVQSPAGIQIAVGQAGGTDQQPTDLSRRSRRTPQSRF